MKTCTKCNIEKDLSFFYNDRYWCISCCKIANKTYYKKNSLVIKERSKNWHLNNKDKSNTHKIKYRLLNRDKVLITQKKYRDNNQNKIKEYYTLNKSKYSFRARQREIAKLNRTPNWLTKQDITYINYLYKFTKNISEYLGQKYHVDHIIPLQGELVSGLHVPSNLQVISATLNLQKGNKYGIRSN